MRFLSASAWHGPKHGRAHGLGGCSWCDRAGRVIAGKRDPLRQSAFVRGVPWRAQIGAAANPRVSKKRPQRGGTC
jgi:hypothetical protein